MTDAAGAPGPTRTTDLDDDSHHALKWLQDVETEADDKSFAAAIDGLNAQQEHLRKSLISGFNSRRELVEWCHAVDVVSAGQTPDDWHYNLLRHRWTVATFLSNEAARDAVCENAPDNQATRKNERKEFYSQVLLPAFESSIKLYRDIVGENSDTGGVRDAERLSFIAARPRLHQRAVGQHKLIRRALGGPRTTPIRSKTDAQQWAKEVILQTEGHVQDGFTLEVVAENSPWFKALTAGNSVELEWRLAADVFPAMNASISAIATQADEAQDTETTRREVPSG